MSLPSFRTDDFEGRPLVTLNHDGHPAWIARQIGDLAGYADGGKRLVKKIRQEWLGELVPGHDLVVLRGLDLVVTRLALGTTLVPGSAKGLMLLLKPGLDLVMARCSKPVGKRLRHFIVDEVLSAWSDQASEAPPAVIRADESVDVFVERERRLKAKLDLDDRRFRAASLRQAGVVLRDLGRIDDETYSLCEVVSAQIALGVGLRDLLSTRAFQG